VTARSIGRATAPLAMKLLRSPRSRIASPEARGPSRSAVSTAHSNTGWPRRPATRAATMVKMRWRRKSSAAWKPSRMATSTVSAISVSIEPDEITRS